MPSSVGVWATAWAEELLEDGEMQVGAYDVVNRCPLGSAASYGVPLPIDRLLTSDLLGFQEPVENVLAADLVGDGQDDAYRVLAEEDFNSFRVIGSLPGVVGLRCPLLIFLFLSSSLDRVTASIVEPLLHEEIDVRRVVSVNQVLLEELLKFGLGFNLRGIIINVLERHQGSLVLNVLKRKDLIKDLI